MTELSKTGDSGCRGQTQTGFLDVAKSYGGSNDRSANFDFPIFLQLRKSDFRLVVDFLL